MSKRTAQEIRGCCEGIRVALKYLRSGHTDLAIEPLEKGLASLEALAEEEVRRGREYMAMQAAREKAAAERVIVGPKKQSWL